MIRAVELLSGARHAAPDHIADAGKMVPAAASTIWHATNPVNEAFWNGVLCATAFFCAAFCVAVSFGVFER